MKKTVFIIILSMLLLLPSCKDETGEVVQSTDLSSVSTEATTISTTNDASPSDTSGKDGLRDIASAALAAGDFGDNMSLVYDDDEFAVDLLEFSYGIEPELAEKIDSYVLSEQSGMEAYSFAYFKFTSDATADDIATVKSVINEVYVGGLKSSLAPYNPDAYALCDEALYKEYDGALLFMICEKDSVDSVLKAVEE